MKINGGDREYRTLFANFLMSDTLSDGKINNIMHPGNSCLALGANRKLRCKVTRSDRPAKRRLCREKQLCLYSRQTMETLVLSGLEKSHDLVNYARINTRCLLSAVVRMSKQLAISNVHQALGKQTVKNPACFYFDVCFSRNFEIRIDRAYFDSEQRYTG